MNLRSIFSSCTSPLLFYLHICLLDLSMMFWFLIKAVLKPTLTFSLMLPGSWSEDVIQISLSLSAFSLLGLWPCVDVQHLHASLVVDGEWPRVQGDTHQPSSFLGTGGPQIYIYIWLSDGFSVHRGGSLLTADPPGCKYLRFMLLIACTAISNCSIHSAASWLIVISAAVNCMF